MSTLTPSYTKKHFNHTLRKSTWFIPFTKLPTCLSIKKEEQKWADAGFAINTDLPFANIGKCWKYLFLNLGSGPFSYPETNRIAEYKLPSAYILLVFTSKEINLGRKSTEHRH